VIVIGAGTFTYLYLTKSLPGQKSAAGCSKSTSITVWQDFSPTEFPAFSKAVTEFEAANPGLVVSWVNDSSPSPSNYVAAALSCTAPDVLIGASDFAGGLYFDGFLPNLTQYVPKSTFSPFIETAVADNTQSGAVFGLPLNVNGVAMIYNKKLVPTAPENTDQMISMAKNITVTTNGKITTAGLIYGVDSDGGYRYPAWLTGFGGQLFNASGAPDLDTQAATNALTFLNNFSTVDKVEPPGITAESTYEDLFAQGQAGMIFDGPWDIQMYVNALGESNVGVAPIPVVSQTGLHPLPLWGSIGAYVSTRNASGASPTLFNESIKFAEFLASPTVEGELFNSSGDIPSLTSTFNYVRSLNISFENGFFDQFFNYSQTFPNTPQMSFYWDPYASEISSYVAGSISASAAMAGIQSSMVMQMQSAHIPPY
jgi:arabinogalactan oligomer / maltooligosaccharide transport system substrate-binding protein